ncbi:MAG: hypothetical protein NTW28_18280 [Candidatus Solibacter sp.]|nr:hypothetical protein [Candidatus Solibacter sp.]
MIARYTGVILAVAGICTSAALYAQTGTPLQIVTDSLPAATVGTPYNQQLMTTGGSCTSVGSASSTIDSGVLPPGIAVSSPAATEQWSLQGTPSAAGSFTFTVHVRWTHTRQTPFQPADCSDDAVKTLMLAVQGSGPPPPATAALAADRTQVTTSYHTGAFPPAADTVRVTAAGGASVAITAQSVTDSGGPWLSVTAQGSTTPAALSISYSIGGLVQGTYTGRVTVTSGGLATLTIPVTLQVVTDSVQLQAAPSSLTFSMVAGGADPPAQSITVTVAGVAKLFQATVSAPPNGKWLTVTPSAAATTATLGVAVTAKDLAAGVYNGALAIAVSGDPSSSRSIPVTFTIQTPLPKPGIAAGGVVDAAGGGRAIAPGTWVSLFGTSLATTTRAWRDADFQNGRLPTTLDGVSVTINGKPAAVAFISPLQINVLAPDDTVTGLVPVRVTNAMGTSDAVVLQQTAAPALFQFSGTKYAAGTHADGSYLAGPGISGTAARVGETIVLYGTGFGATQPPISATALVPAPLSLARPEDLRVRIGGLDAAMAYAGLISPGVYQFNVVVPQVGEGDQSVVAELRGLLTQPNLLLTVQR